MRPKVACEVSHGHKYFCLLKYRMCMETSEEVSRWSRAKHKWSHIRARRFERQVLSFDMYLLLSVERQYWCARCVISRLFGQLLNWVSSERNKRNVFAPSNSSAIFILIKQTHQSLRKNEKNKERKKQGEWKNCDRHWWWHAVTTFWINNSVFL